MKGENEKKEKLLKQIEKTLEIEAYQTLVVVEELKDMEKNGYGFKSSPVRSEYIETAEWFLNEVD